MKKGVGKRNDTNPRFLYVFDFPLAIARLKHRLIKNPRNTESDYTEIQDVLKFAGIFYFILNDIKVHDTTGIELFDSGGYVTEYFKIKC